MGTYGELRATKQHKAPKHIVHWDTNSKFADNGDCGAVYFLKKKGQFVPLAVHVASGKTVSGRYVSAGEPLTGLVSTSFGGYYLDFGVTRERFRNFVQYPLEDETTHETLV